MIKIIKKLKQKVKGRVLRMPSIIQNNAGLSVVEMILILVVIIALVLIFKSQLIALVNTIFQKITSESAGI